MYFDAKEFGKRLHDVRTSRGITQEELAVRLGLASKQHVSRMENGERNCSIDLLIELSCILHVSTDYLLMGSEPSKEEVKNDLLSIFNLRQGGIAIYGAVIGAVATVFVYSRVKKLSFPVMLDTACIGLVAGQILGRWGNFFNREAFGGYTDNLFAMQLPVSAVRVHEITDEMWAHVQIIGGEQFIQVHPTFLYESLWNVGVICFLYWYRKRKKFQGELFLTYLLGYGLGRAWIEGLRTDQLQIGMTGIPVSQMLACILVIFSAVTILWGRSNAKRKEQAKTNE